MTDEELGAIVAKHLAGRDRGCIALAYGAALEIREACAKVCDDFADAIKGSSYDDYNAMKLASGVARQAGTRIRGTTEGQTDG